MKISYVGSLSSNDPMYGYLKTDIAPQLGFYFDLPHFRVYQFAYSQDVYLYEEKNSGFKVVGKFSPDRYGLLNGAARYKAETEYRNLIFLRNLGFDRFPSYVVRPLGFNPAINNLQVLEYLEGQLLEDVIGGAIREGRRSRLYKRLSVLAYFLARMHNCTANDRNVGFHDGCDYMGQLINSLRKRLHLGQEHADELYYLREVWRAREIMWTDRAVIVHGDITPSNIMFGRDGAVLCIDLERMKWADRVFDLGRLGGELKHSFFLTLQDPHAAEPFIGHFLWEYSGHFPDREKTFASITRRFPFYLALNLLRIARNSWIDWDYRWRLVREAKKILKAAP
jgi:serine/threonine protein kinase